MIRKLIGVGCVLVLMAMAAPTWAGDCKGCQTIAEGKDGFCHGKGRIFGVELASQKLYDTLAGAAIDKTKLDCPGCKAAAKNDGWCDKCKLALAGDRAFRSPYAHRIARGQAVNVEVASKCAGCKAARDTNGFCTACNVGYVADRVFSDKESYEQARDDRTTLQLASRTATKCESCAVGLVTDGECERCKVRYKEGKPLEQ